MSISMTGVQWLLRHDLFWEIPLNLIWIIPAKEHASTSPLSPICEMTCYADCWTSDLDGQQGLPHSRAVLSRLVPSFWQVLTHSDENQFFAYVPLGCPTETMWVERCSSIPLSLYNHDVDGKASTPADGNYVTCGATVESSFWVTTDLLARFHTASYAKPCFVPASSVLRAEMVWSSFVPRVLIIWSEF